MTSLSSSGARGGLHTIAAQVAIVLVRLLSLVVLARLLAPEIFGLVAIVTAITTLMTSIVFLGIPMALAQADYVSHRARSAFFLINTGIGLMMSLILVSISPFLAQLYDEPALLPIALWLSLVPLVAGLQSQFRTQLVLDLRFGTLSAIEVVSLIAGSAVAIALAVCGHEYEAVVSQVLVPVVLQLAALLFVSGWLPSRPGSWATEVRKLIGVGLHIFGANFIRTGSRNLIVPVAGLVVPVSALGAYDRAQQLTIAPISLTVDQLQRVAVPILSRLRATPDRMLAFMRRAQHIGAYGTATVFLFLAAVGDILVRWLMGPDWALAGTLLQILALGAAFRALGETMQWLFISSGNARAGMRLSAWSQPLIAVFSLAGLVLGIEGIAWANSLAWLAYWPVASIAAAKAAGFPPYSLIGGVVRVLVSFSIPVALAGAVARLIPSSGDAMTVILALVLSIVAALFSIISSRRVRSDLARMLALATGRR